MAFLTEEACGLAVGRATTPLLSLVWRGSDMFLLRSAANEVRSGPYRTSFQRLLSDADQPSAAVRAHCNKQKGDMLVDNPFQLKLLLAEDLLTQ